MNPDKLMLMEYAASAQSEARRAASNPMADALDMWVATVNPEEGRVVLLFEPKPLFVQGAGVLQGGAVAAMLDFAMGYAAMITLPGRQAVATTNIDVQLLRAALLGRYRACGAVSRKTRAAIFTQAQLTDVEGNRLFATASSTLLPVGKS